MRKPQTGYLFEASNGFHVRFYLYSQAGKRIHKSHKLCDRSEATPSLDSLRVQELREDFMRGVNAAVASERSGGGHWCPVCGGRCARNIQQKFQKA